MRVLYHISLKNLSLICLGWLCICYIDRSHTTLQIESIKIVSHCWLMNNILYIYISVHLPNFKFLDISNKYYRLWSRLSIFLNENRMKNKRYVRECNYLNYNLLYLLLYLSKEFIFNVHTMIFLRVTFIGYKLEISTAANPVRHNSYILTTWISGTMASSPLP